MVAAGFWHVGVGLDAAGDDALLAYRHRFGSLHPLRPVDRATLDDGEREVRDGQVARAIPEGVVLAFESNEEFGYAEKTAWQLSKESRLMYSIKVK